MTNFTFIEITIWFFLGFLGACWYMYTESSGMLIWGDVVAKLFAAVSWFLFGPAALVIAFICWYENSRVNGILSKKIRKK